MEVEKPFKCSVCNARFTNEDHLQVHSRRHEMSLNLSKFGNTAQSEGFVDETPTPTRFIRNCEEVGLFQDLQNVNPFDEQFTKASSATPSTENFEFHFSTIASTSSSTTVTSTMRRSCDQDTLNTPQVLGYPVISSTTSTTSTTTAPNTISIPTTLPLPTSCNSDSSVTVADSDKGSNVNAQVQNPGISTTTPTKAAPMFVLDSTPETLQSPDLKSFQLVRSVSSKCRSKSNLRLNVTPSKRDKFSDPDESEDNQIAQQKPQASKSSKKQLPEEQDKKFELLERNRAAASRSRSRRKLWICNLESRCQTLESQLAQAHSELIKLRNENLNLKDQLSHHSSCEVTRAELKNQPMPVQKSQQPHILRQNPQILVPQSRLPLPSSVVSTQQIKAKRGRPRKGQEKRVELVSVPIAASAASPSEVPVKVQIMPISHGSGQIVILNSPS